uniref:Uncharacterized protein n=1 Tax=Chromera velia CCMP2878 TaxID=1169474 RepID=A0A0G4FRD9_9ALVE|eukprot:Cvel_3625.t1-p1 / transcript=Cvel_3625.t1 / gene=Cvel_3625 / organism=Chromera_velia_CCMP2878 / gene_product=hypothetical protein / transcript_product=hypothetical protein / location=Cvel_scaffold149:3531-3734(-) / protein_length=68 / sequence_SO=supercontig / SO=protein_coding / is_pseudo=false
MAQCYTVVPQEADNMLLSPEEFRDALTLHYEFKAQGDKRNCEGYGVAGGCSMPSIAREGDMLGGDITR